MRAAKIFRGGLDESCPRNKKFCYSNPLTLRNNLLVTGEFLSSLGKTNPLDFDKSLLWRGVDADVILSYLQAMIFHENDNSFNEIDISRHINTRLAKNELNNWSVGLINNSKGKINSPLMEGGFDHSFGLPTRSRLSGKESIGELMQSIHFALDLPGKREKYRIDGKFSYNRMYQERKPENPLLLIYVIDKDSEISSQSKQPRQVLFNQYQERVDIVALAIAFPKANMTEEERSEQNRDYFALGGIANEPENDAE